jgi:hypothetical protein
MIRSMLRVGALAGLWLAAASTPTQAQYGYVTHTYYHANGTMSSSRAPIYPQQQQVVYYQQPQVVYYQQPQVVYYQQPQVVYQQPVVGHVHYTTPGWGYGGGWGRPQVQVYQNYAQSDFAAMMNLGAAIANAVNR